MEPQHTQQKKMRALLRGETPRIWWPVFLQAQLKQILGSNEQVTNHRNRINHLQIHSRGQWFYQRTGSHLDKRLLCGRCMCLSPTETNIFFVISEEKIFLPVFLSQLIAITSPFLHYSVSHGWYKYQGHKQSLMKGLGGIKTARAVPRTIIDWPDVIATMGERPKAGREDLQELEEERHFWFVLVTPFF